MHLNLILCIKRIGHRSTFLLTIPLALSAFSHLWNPVGFPYGPSNDEGIYIRRAMDLIEGQGPQESFLYDHPYFAQIFLAGVLGIIGYPNSLHISVAGSDGNLINTIELLWLVPRVLMGLLAIFDTFLIYKIAERRYNRTVALIASIIFAVAPTTWIIRRVWLEPIQLPFLLCSILFAIYSKKNPSVEKEGMQNQNKRYILLVLLSGIFLGLAIFTKIPVFTLIPLVGFLVYTSNNNGSIKALGLWFIPVILIPLIWPAYALYINEFNLWLNGIYFETHRKTQTLFEAIEYNFRNDSIWISLGIVGLVFTAIKKDIFPLLWTLPFLAVLYFAGFVSFWHLIPLFPIFCIASAILIEKVWRRLNVSSVERTLFSIILGVAFFVGILHLTEGMIVSDNSSHFKAVAFVSQYLYNNTDFKNKIMLISNPFYSWIPKYAFHLDNYQIVDYYDNIPVKGERVAFIVDSEWKDRLNQHRIGYNMQKNFNLYGKNEAAKFSDLYYNVSIYEYNQPIHDEKINENTFGSIDNLSGYDNITSPNRQ